MSQCNGCRKMTPSGHRLVLCKPCFHLTTWFAIRTDSWLNCITKETCRPLHNQSGKSHCLEDRVQSKTVAVLFCNTHANSGIPGFVSCICRDPAAPLPPFPFCSICCGMLYQLIMLVFDGLGLRFNQLS